MKGNNDKRNLFEALSTNILLHFYCRVKSYNIYFITIKKNGVRNRRKVAIIINFTNCFKSTFAGRTKESTKFL